MQRVKSAYEKGFKSNRVFPFQKVKSMISKKLWGDSFEPGEYEIPKQIVFWDGENK